LYAPSLTTPMKMSTPVNFISSSRVSTVQSRITRSSSLSTQRFSVAQYVLEMAMYCAA
jgi:hypothetical protein